MHSNPKKSVDNELIVDFLTWAEPNNGRMLWRVNIEYKKQNVNQSVFEGQWNYINFDIKNWELNNLECTFYYIPVEGISKLISKKGFEVFPLTFQGVSTSRFFGNKFTKTNLIEIYHDQIIFTNLKSKVSRIEKMENFGLVERVELLNSNEIEIWKSTHQNKSKKVFNHRFKIEE